MEMESDKKRIVTESTCEGESGTKMGEIVQSEKNDESTSEVVTLTDGPRTGGKKTLSLLSAILYLAGSIVGTGIFMSAGEITVAIPSIFYIMLFWMFCGLVALGAGLCYAELGLLLPSCGGEYAYFIAAYHDFVGFSFMLSNLLFIKPLSVAILVNFTATTIFGIFMDDTPRWLIRLLCCAIVIVLFALHSLSDYLSIKLNDILTYSKFVGMVIIFGIAMHKLAVDGPVNVRDWGFDIEILPANISIAIYNCMWTYDGFNMLAYVVEEMANPSRNLVIASVVALTGVVVLYLIINFCYFIVLGVNGMRSTEEVARALAEPYMGKFTFFLLISIALSALGAANSTAYSGARIYFDAARSNHVPSILAAVHRRFKTVIPSLLVQALLSILYLITIDKISALLAYFSNAIWVYYTLAIFSVIVLRYRMPGERIFKVPYAIAVVLTIISGSFVVLSFYDNWKVSLISLAVVASTLPVYLIFVYKESPLVKKNVFSFITPATQTLMRIFHLELSESPL